MRSSCSLGELLGYVASWSAYATYRQQHPGRPDPLAELQQQLMAALGAADLSHEVHVVWPLAVVLAKGPVKGAAPRSSADQSAVA